MSNIRRAFDDGKTFAVFVTCGDPDADSTVRAAVSAANDGAAFIELGIPFSDPTAEGAEVQEANVRALSNGMTTDGALELAGRIREQVNTPLVFVAYANVVFSYGADRFLSACAARGVDGLIVHDLPYEEKDEFLPYCRKHGVALISAIAPAEKDRVAMIAREAEGFINVVGCAGMAGAGGSVVTEISDLVALAHLHSDLPCVITSPHAEPSSTLPHLHRLTIDYSLTRGAR